MVMHLTVDAKYAFGAQTTSIIFTGENKHNQIKVQQKYGLILAHSHTQNQKQSDFTRYGLSSKSQNA